MCIRDRTTTALALRDELSSESVTAVVLDGDDLRTGLSRDLDFSGAGRDEQVRRAGEIALLLNRQGVTVIVSLISPRAVARRAVRSLHVAAGLAFLEVYIATPLEVCERRDPKALYSRARAGHETKLTGIGDPYDVPATPDVVISTEHASALEVARTILTAWRGATLRADDASDGDATAQ